MFCLAMNTQSKPDMKPDEHRNLDHDYATRYDIDHMPDHIIPHD